MFSVVAKALPLNGPAPRAWWFLPLKNYFWCSGRKIVIS